jgi:hypothetical protein
MTTKTKTRANTNTAMAHAMVAAAQAKMTQQPKRQPVQTITGNPVAGKRYDDVWLSSALTTALVKTYGDDLDAVQKGAEWLVQEGYVALPHGWTLKAFRRKQYGDKISVVAEPIGAGPVRASGLSIPFPKF